MIVIPGRIPIIIHPFFWVLALLIGVLNSQSWIGILVWVGVIVVSVLVHEFGHALTAVFFKQKARVQLIAFGGLTSYEGPKLSFGKQFLIVFNGPLFGFFLFLAASFLLRYNWSSYPVIFFGLKITQVANLFWSIVNLLPVIPLDGGQLLRIALEARFGIQGFKASLLIGSVIAVLFSFYFFVIQAFLVGAIFFLFAYQSFDSWRKSRIASDQDRNEENKDLFLKGETLLHEGKEEEARQIFQEILDKNKKGILAIQASQYLALLCMKEGKKKEAYELLLQCKDHVESDLKCLLHRLSYEFENYAIVAELSQECYQIAPSQEMALRNARSFAHLKQGQLAGGWLKAAASYEKLDLSTILKESQFEALKNDQEFKEFVDKLR